MIIGFISIFWRWFKKDSKCEEINNQKQGIVKLKSAVPCFFDKIFIDTKKSEC
jgi:hypothetical protein